MVRRANPQPDIEDAALVAELREAFSSCDYRLDGVGLVALGVLDSGGRSGSPRMVPNPLVSGSRLDDFEIIEEIGHGGMGVVYRARQVSLDREVALKVLPVGAQTHGRESARRRFRTEAQAVARLNHPNVVPVFAHGEHEDRLYFAMELVDGVSLDVAMRSQPELLSSTFAHSGSGPYLRTNERPTSPPSRDCSGSSSHSNALNSAPAPDSTAEAPDDATTSLLRTAEDFRYLASLMADVADGLSHAHEHGVIHRDIKPQNLLLGSDGRLRITDFGLAQLTDQPGLTVTGEIMGTPAYLPPEQVRGGARRVDHRADIYSL
ncbi:MAG: serine/threonine protein kinase, partial [Planctomycetes bacterium]|nr:serine/threonine protein kinase [Planctomycetota bacterium]